MDVTITTRYRPRPNSNVGAFVATAQGKQRSIVDQSIADPHRAAADALAEVIGRKVVGEPRHMTQDGQRRRWSTVPA